MHTGVYQIICKPTGRRYIGSTGWSFTRRWGKHKRDLCAGKHHSPRLQNAWNKHGPDAFAFIVLERTAPADAVASEQVWMDRLKPVFNVNPQATSSLGTKRTPEQRARIAAGARRRHAEGRGATEGLLRHVKSDAHRAFAREHALNNQPKAAAARRKVK